MHHHYTLRWPIASRPEYRLHQTRPCTVIRHATQFHHGRIRGETRCHCTDGHSHSNVTHSNSEPLVLHRSHKGRHRIVPLTHREAQRTQAIPVPLGRGSGHGAEQAAMLGMQSMQQL
jgi:hypothetical protein